MACCIMIIRWHATCDHLFPTFFWSAPSRRDSMSGACFPGWGPGHWGRSWCPPRRLSKSKALRPRPGRCAPRSAAACRLRRFFPKTRLAAVGFRRTTGHRGRCAGEDERCGNAELYTRSTDKRTMNVLDSTSSKLFTFTNTLDKFQYIFFTTLLLMKKYVILIAFSMMMRPVRTMSSIRW